MEDYPTQVHKDFDGTIKHQGDEIAFGARPSGSYSSAPPRTGEWIGAPLRKQSSSTSVHVPSLSTRTPSRNQLRQASTGSTGTSLTIPPLPFYSEDIPLMKEEDAGGFRWPWVWFVTLGNREGGRYRQRSWIADGGGGFSDVWKCDSIFSDGSNVVVAVKKLRAVQLPSGLSEAETRPKLLKRLKKELRIWMQLHHPNIAPLLGFTFDEEIAIISPWFSQGNLLDYLKVHPEADRMQLVQGVAAGLQYLHSPSPVVIHGDMKPDNVLIDKWGCPRIIDFGLSKMVEEDTCLPSLSTSLRDGGNARWMAPELLLEEWVPRSLQADMYSFGCVAFFIFTLDVPFKGTHDRQLEIARYNGASPIQDSYPNLNTGDPLMEVLRACWTTSPEERPKIGDVVQRLNRAYPGSHLSAWGDRAIQTKRGQSVIKNWKRFFQNIFKGLQR